MTIMSYEDFKDVCAFMRDNGLHTYLVDNGSYSFWLKLERERCIENGCETLGWFSRSTRTICLYGLAHIKGRQVYATFCHEYTHLCQLVEGRMGGSNPEKEIARIKRAFSFIREVPYNVLYKVAFEMYRHNSGECEARRNAGEDDTTPWSAQEALRFVAAQLRGYIWVVETVHSDSGKAYFQAAVVVRVIGNTAVYVIVNLIFGKANAPP